ncbi:hypothetical protein JCM8547_004241 [Rhodosporidiobolus lusitaniae]
MASKLHTELLFYIMELTLPRLPRLLFNKLRFNLGEGGAAVLSGFEEKIVAIHLCDVILNQVGDSGYEVIDFTFSHLFPAPLPQHLTRLVLTCTDRHLLLPVFPSLRTLIVRNHNSLPLDFRLDQTFPSLRNLAWGLSTFTNLPSPKAYLAPSLRR